LNTLIVLLDGAADDKIPELGGMTPLESLEKKFIDNIASHGEFGWTDGKAYTHLFLLEFLTGKSLNVPRGLVEAVGLGVPVEPNQVAYRFSPVQLGENSIDWVYRVSPQMHALLQDSMIRNLDVLGDLNPRLYFYDDGRGVLTMETDHVQDFPSPPAPVVNKAVPLGEFDRFIHRVGKELNGLTVLPWGGGSVNEGGKHLPVPSAKNMVMVSKSPSALGVGGLLNLHREVVDNMWSGFQESFRLLRSSNVFMHVEETDDISHRRAPDQKVSLLKEVDDVLMENLDRLIGYRVAFIIDHGTSSLTGQHLRMNVPYAVAEVTEPTKPTVRFCEKATKYRPLTELFDSLVT
jgi:2,3-bisphosphoglycerate-independent phosphoglycerate mutase